MSTKTLLDVLLADDPSARDDRPTAPWTWERHGIQIPCQGLFVDEIRALRKKATTKVVNPKTHELEDQFDFEKFTDLLIIACTPGAPWTDERVRQHYGVAEATAALRRALRHPGDYRSLSEHCQALCGMSDLGTLQAEDQVKN